MKPVTDSIASRFGRIKLNYKKINAHPANNDVDIPYFMGLLHSIVKVVDLDRMTRADM